MNKYTISIAALLFSLVILSEAYPHDKRRFLRRHSSHDDAEQARLALYRAKRGILDCKNEGESCRGFPPCCGDNVCYWENGFSARRPGVCVTCVARTQMCQRDGQCCESLICHKETTYTVNGRCDEKLPLGAECHDNDQCESDHCEIHWYNDIVMGHGGNCTNP